MLSTFAESVEWITKEKKVFNTEMKRMILMKFLYINQLVQQWNGRYGHCWSDTRELPTQPLASQPQVVVGNIYLVDWSCLCKFVCNWLLHVWMQKEEAEENANKTYPSWIQASASDRSCLVGTETKPCSGGAPQLLWLCFSWFFCILLLHKIIYYCKVFWNWSTRLIIGWCFWPTGHWEVFQRTLCYKSEKVAISGGWILALYVWQTPPIHSYSF